MRPLLTSVELVWDATHTTAFNAVKAALNTPRAPVLAHFDLSRPSRMETDAPRPVLHGLGHNDYLETLLYVRFVGSEEEKTNFRTPDKDGKGMVEIRFALSVASSVSDLKYKCGDCPVIGKGLESQESGRR